MKSTVEKIKERLNIADVVSQYITLERSGAGLKARCPFHHEKTPSFFVSPERGTYYCFGCGAKGDIFSFVEQFEGLDFKGSLKVLADKAGVDILEYKGGSNRNSAEKIEKDRKELIYEAMELSTLFYENNLHSTSGKEAMDYLISRGLKLETIKTFRIGFIGVGWQNLYEHLKKMGIKDDIMLSAGLIKKSEKSSGYYDRFRDRIIFPIFDSAGRVLAFTGRILHDDGKSAKYLNSPETPIFTKSNVLYGLDKAKSYIRQKGYSIFVEGQMDLIMSYQAGYRNVVAGSGTALTTDTSLNSNSDSGDVNINNFGVLKRLSPNIIFAYDGDSAGQKASIRSAEIAIGLGMDVKMVSLPLGLDPADAIKKDVNIWIECLKKAKHPVEFLLDLIINISTDERRIARAITEKIIPFLAKVSSNSERSYLIKIIKDRVNVPEEAILQDIKEYSKKNINSGTNYNKSIKDSIPYQNKTIFSKENLILRRLMGLVLLFESKKDDNLNFLKDKICKILNRDYNEVITSFNGLEHDLLFEAEANFSNSKNLTEEMAILLKTLETEVLKSELTKIMKEISKLEKNKDEEKARELLAKYQETLKKIKDLD